MHEKMASLSGILLVVACILLVAARLSDNMGLAAVGLLMAATVWPISMLADYLRRKENEKNPITLVEATVVGHRIETYRGRYSSTNTYYLSFKPEDGSEKLEFVVPESVYHDFSAGDKGPLRYRTWEYISFCEKDISRLDPIAPIPEEYESAPTEITVEEGWDRVLKLLDMLTSKVQALYIRGKEWFALTTKKNDTESQSELEQDDGILTHELDE